MPSLIRPRLERVKRLLHRGLRFTRRVLGRCSHRGRHADDQAIDRLLESWSIEPAAADLARRIVQHARTLPQEPPGKGPAVNPWFISRLWPGFVAIALALALGWIAGASDWAAPQSASAADEWLAFVDLALMQEDASDP